MTTQVSEDELIRRFLVATHGLFNAGVGSKNGPSETEDKRMQFNSYLTHFVKTQEAWIVCCKVLRLTPHQLVAQYVPELAAYQDKVWSTAVFFASQSIQGMSRRARQLGHAAELHGGLSEIEKFLQEALAAFARPPLANADVAARVRVQLFLAYGALAIRSWDSTEILPRVFSTFQDGDLLHILRVVAELAGDEGIALGRDNQRSLDAALQAASPRILEALASVCHTATSSESNVSMTANAQIFDALLSCLSAWLAIEAIQVSDLSSSSLVPFVFDLLEHLASTNTVMQWPSLVSTALEVVNHIATLATCDTSNLTKDPNALRQDNPGRWTLRNRLSLRALLHVLRGTMGPNGDTKLAANACATIVATSQAYLSILGEPNLLNNSNASAQIENAIAAVSSCLTTDFPLDVISATFEFWYICHEIYQHVAPVEQIPVEIKRKLKQGWEQAVVTYCSELLLIPEDKVYIGQMDRNARDEFKMLRKEFRHLLRVLFANRSSLLEFIGWVRSLITDQQQIRQLPYSWRRLESGLHGLSALAQSIPCRHDDTQVILESLTSLVCVELPVVHRALLRTCVILSGAMSVPAREASPQVVARLLECAHASLYACEEDAIFPMRETEDHVGTVALTKLTASRSCALVLSEVRLRKPSLEGKLLFQDLHDIFSRNCANILSKRARYDDPMITITSPDATKTNLCMRSIDLLLQTLCYFAYHCKCEAPEMDDRLMTAMTGPIQQLLESQNVAHVIQGFHLSMVLIGSANRMRTDNIDANNAAHHDFVRVSLPAFELARKIMHADRSLPFAREVSEELLESVFAFLSVFCMGAMPAHAADLKIAVSDARTVISQDLSSVASAFALKFLVSLLRQAEDVQLDHTLVIYLFDCVTGLVHQLSKVEDLEDLMDSEPDALRLTLQLARAALSCATITRRMEQPRPQDATLEKVFELHRATTELVFQMLDPATEAEESALDAQLSQANTSKKKKKLRKAMGAEELQDQDFAMELLQTIRTIVFGSCGDQEDVFQRPMQTMPAWFCAIRDNVFEQYGLRFTRSLLRAGGGRMPAWAIERIALCLRAELGQYGVVARNWIEEALRDPLVPRPGANPTLKGIFMDKLGEAKSAAHFKRHLKQLCGGKRKGAQHQRPKADQPRKAFVMAT